MMLLPVVYNTQMEGTVSQISSIGPSFDFMIKNGKLVVIVFFDIYCSFHKMKNKSSIKNLRHRSLVLDLQNGY